MFNQTRPHSLLASLKKSLINISLAITSIAVTYALIEFLLIPVIIERGSLKSQALFPPAMRILSQSSKDALVPENYILILGDSYAMGFGDWLDLVDKEANPPYHSAHIIYQQSGRDVISFGEGGAGSITGFVTMPVRRFEALKRFDVDMPKTILIYFYEGNDVTDNIGYLRRHYHGKYEEENIYSEKYFGSFLENEVRRKTANKKYTDRLYLAGYIVKLYKAFKSCLIEICWIKSNSRDSQSNSVTHGDINKVLVSNKSRGIPDHLQSPALELTSEEIDLSLYVFEQSLVYLKKYFANARVHIIYIPSPLTSYRIISEQVSIQNYEKDISLFRSDKVEEYSSRIRHDVELIAEKYQTGFLDTTSIIKKAATSWLIHGPNDWRHFNEIGYRLLGKTIAEYLYESEKSSDD